MSAEEKSYTSRESVSPANKVKHKRRTGDRFSANARPNGFSNVDDA